MGICYLVGAGDFYGHISVEDDDIIIAADGGYDNLVRRGITPDILIGDFDSIKSFIPDDIRTVRYPREKDETDMFLSYEAGVKFGYTEFVMLGATGGRLDHTFANISLLLYAKKKGHNITIIDGRGMLLCIKDEAISLAGNSGAKLSIFALGGVATGVSILGTKYEVEDVKLTPDFPLGVSNEFKEESARISVKNGALLIIAE